jgi:outer membrane protein
MKVNKGFIVITILFLICIGCCIWIKLSVPKIAYIKSGDLVAKYAGMLEAKKMYKDKMSKWQSNIDTLQNDYQRSVSNYHLDQPKLSSPEKSKREELLKKQEMNIRQYVSSLEQKAQEEDQKMTEGVLNQINSFVKEYGQSHGYDVILGTTAEGNLLYGKDGIDITEEVLVELNKNYSKTINSTKNE